MKKYGCIYKLTNDINGKVYIGQTILLDENDLPTERWRSYKNLNCKNQPKIYRALKKYSPNNFTFEILGYYHNKKELDCGECYWMDKFDSIANGYNIKEGGSHGKRSQETKLKISLAKKGKTSNRKGVKLSQETRDKMSLVHKGHKHSQETKLKIGLGNKGKKRS